MCEAADVIDAVADPRGLEHGQNTERGHRRDRGDAECAEECGDAERGKAAGPGGERQQPQQEHGRLRTDQLTDQARNRGLPERAQRRMPERHRSDNRQQPAPDGDVGSKPDTVTRASAAPPAMRLVAMMNPAAPAGTFRATRPTHCRNGKMPSVQHRPSTIRATPSATHPGAEVSAGMTAAATLRGRCCVCPIEQRNSVEQSGQADTALDEVLERGHSSTRVSLHECADRYQAHEQQGDGGDQGDHLALRGNRLGRGRRDQDEAEKALERDGMLRTVLSLMRHVIRAVTQARMAMKSAKLSTTKPPPHTEMAIPDGC